MPSRKPKTVRETAKDFEDTKPSKRPSTGLEAQPGDGLGMKLPIPPPDNPPAPPDLTGLPPDALGPVGPPGGPPGLLGGGPPVAPPGGPAGPPGPPQTPPGAQDQEAFMQQLMMLRQLLGMGAQ